MNTVRWSGSSGSSGNASRNFAITVGLLNRKNVLIPLDLEGRHVGVARVLIGDLSSIGWRILLSGSRFSVNRRLFSM